jgi:hypothetical protein
MYHALYTIADETSKALAGMLKSDSPTESDSTTQAANAASSEKTRTPAVVIGGKRLRSTSPTAGALSVYVLLPSLRLGEC